MVNNSLIRGDGQVLLGYINMKRGSGAARRSGRRHGTTAP